MSYIFSSNGNEYTFKKMDNMLINLPDKDGKHILIRSSKDGDTKYSWQTVNLIVNVNDIKATAYNPYQLTKVKGQTIYFDVFKGMNIVTIHAVLYNMNDNAFRYGVMLGMESAGGRRFWNGVGKYSIVGICLFEITTFVNKQ